MENEIFVLSLYQQNEITNNNKKNKAMKNLDYKIQVLEENAKECEMSLLEYVNHSKENDPNFFRWLFEIDLENDFSMSLTESQKLELEEFLLTIQN